MITTNRRWFGTFWHAIPTKRHRPNTKSLPSGGKCFGYTFFYREQISWFWRSIPEVPVKLSSKCDISSKGSCRFLYYSYCRQRVIELWKLHQTGRSTKLYSRNLVEHQNHSSRRNQPARPWVNLLWKGLSSRIRAKVRSERWIGGQYGHTGKP